jgi:hypothetical protein
VASIGLDDGKVNVMSGAMLADIASALTKQRETPRSSCCAQSGRVFSQPASI